MQKYSHEAFTVAGVVLHIPNHTQAMQIIPEAWKQRFMNKTSDMIVGQSDPSMHAVYYNYDDSKTSFDMLIGVMTEQDAIQTNDTITTLTVPAQDYRYMTVEWGFPNSIWGARDSINQMSLDELPRTYGYDLEMYNEAWTECTIAVSVKE